MRARKAKTALVRRVPVQMPAPSAVREVHDIPKAIRSAIHAFEQAIGGRQALVEALSTGDADAQVSAVLDILGDTTNDQHALSKICAQAGISPGQLFAAFDRATIMRARILAKVEASRAVPAVAREVARTALPHETVCEACNGTGGIRTRDESGRFQRTPCEACHGVGQTRRPGDPAQQQKIFELTGLVRTGGGLTIAQQVVTPPIALGSGTLEQLQQAASALLAVRPALPDPPVLDVSEGK